MKICLINNLYKPYNRGGAERIVELIARGLQNQGHDVFVITTLPVGKKHENPPPLPPPLKLWRTRKLRRAGTKIRQSEAGPLLAEKHEIYYISALYYNLNFLPKFLRLFWHVGDMFDVGSYFRVKSILKKEKPDIVMTHNLKGVGYLIPKAIRSLSIRHIHTLHDIQLLHPSGLMIHNKERKVDSNLSKMYANVCCWLFNSPDTVISPSKWLMKMHVDRGFFKESEKVVIPNPSPPADAKSLAGKPAPLPLRWERGAGINGRILRDSSLSHDKVVGEGQGGGFRFLYIGQIEEHKGILFLIKVFKMLREDLEDASCELVIVGDGSKLKQAQKLAGNDGRIKFLGKISHKDLQVMMQKYNALVVPSLCYENSPTVIYEALSAGLPVIASRIGGTAELVHKTAGILFKPDNHGDLMYQMKWAMRHPRELQKIGETGREKVKQFGLDEYIFGLFNKL